MLWDKAGTHQVESLYATLQPLQTSWAGSTEVILSCTWCCPCGRQQAFCSTFEASIAGGVWEAAQAELTGLCRQLGLTEPPPLLPVSSSGFYMSWEASWKRHRP